MKSEDEEEVEEAEEEEKEREEISLEEYGSTTGCDTSLSRIELARGSKFTESGGHFFFSFLRAFFPVRFFCFFFSLFLGCRASCIIPNRLRQEYSLNPSQLN